MSIYSVNFGNFIRQLLPPVLRKSILVAWIYALIRPLRELHQRFKTYHEARREEILYNGQVIKLEHLLNELFNYGLTGIYIVHNEVTQGAFFLFDEGFASEGMDIYLEGEGKGPYLYENAEMVPAAVAFTVMVPEGLELDEAALRAWIGKYKLFGSTFKIERYK